MEQKEIYDLIARFEGSSLTVMEIEQDAFKIHLEKGGRETQPIQAAAPQIQIPRLRRRKMAMRRSERLW